MIDKKSSIIKLVKHINTEDIPEEIYYYIKLNIKYDWCENIIKHDWEYSEMLNNWIISKGVIKNEEIWYNLNPKEDA